MLQFQRGLLNDGGTSVTHPLSVSGLDSQRNYNLDLVGNWVTNGSTAATSFIQGCGNEQYEDRTTNALNQVATLTDGSNPEVTLTYDAAGNLLDDGTLSYVYDALNRLKEVYLDSDDTQIAAYTYDAQNRRVQKIVTGGGLTGDIPNGTTMYAYDGDQCVEEYDGSTNLQRQYVWGQYVDELIQQREYKSPPPGRTYVDYYPLSDLLWRTVGLTNDTLCNGSSSGTGGGGGGGGAGRSSGEPALPFVEVYDTDVYGNTTIYTSPGTDGQWFTEDDVVGNNPRCAYLFTGRYFDAETQNYFYRARFYSPKLGRFVSRDSIGYVDGMGLYQYVHSKPAISVDPTGKTDTERRLWKNMRTYLQGQNPRDWRILQLSLLIKYNAWQEYDWNSNGGKTSPQQHFNWEEEQYLRKELQVSGLNVNVATGFHVIERNSYGDDQVTKVLNFVGIGHVDVYYNGVLIRVGLGGASPKGIDITIAGRQAYWDAAVYKDYQLSRLEDKTFDIGNGATSWFTLEAGIGKGKSIGRATDDEISDAIKKFPSLCGAAGALDNCRSDVRNATWGAGLQGFDPGITGAGWTQKQSENWYIDHMGRQ